MQCEKDDTELKHVPGSTDTFGPGTFVTVCPLCDTFVSHIENIKGAKYFVTKNERKIILRGFEAQARRAKADPPIVRSYLCPHCGEVLRIVEKPTTAFGTFYEDKVGKVAYIVLRDTEKICKCYVCNKKFSLFLR